MHMQELVVHDVYTTFLYHTDTKLCKSYSMSTDISCKRKFMLGRKHVEFYFLPEAILVQLHEHK